MTFLFVGQQPSLYSSSISINALTDNIGVGSYVVSKWSFANPILSSPSYVKGSNNPNNLVRYTTSPISYGNNGLLIASSTSYDLFDTGTTPPIWSNNTIDNLVQYGYQGSGQRPLWVSYSISNEGDISTYSSPESDIYSTGVSVTVLSF